MGLKVKNTQPIYFQCATPNLTIEDIRQLLPEAIEIVSVIPKFPDMNYLIYKILMPYKFTIPTQPVFGNRLTVSYLYRKYGNSIWRFTSTSTYVAPFEILAQDVDYIYDEVMST